VHTQTLKDHDPVTRPNPEQRRPGPARELEPNVKNPVPDLVAQSAQHLGDALEFSHRPFGSEARERGNKAPPAPDHIDETIALQQPKRLTDRRPTDCKPLRQLMLARELRPGKKLLHANRFDELITYLYGERSPIARHLK
jgi:hypothetical protein